MSLKLVNPPHLGKPVGFAHGVQTGGFVFVSGQIGTTLDPKGEPRLVSAAFVAQFEAALANVVEVVKAAGGVSEDIVEFTIFVKDMSAYRRARAPLGEVWQRILGKHYPAVTLVEVSDLFESGAHVEIRAVASIGGV